MSLDDRFRWIARDSPYPYIFLILGIGAAARVLWQFAVEYPWLGEAVLVLASVACGLLVARLLRPHPGRQRNRR
jgi:hypothetical protein